ncbi:hypothetical protein D082_30650 [Synechocystis sp. PCC 6714]|nr:hypothetical protein D082_30650 [Synechocystis sp. PCC 6714]
MPSITIFIDCQSWGIAGVNQTFYVQKYVQKKSFANKIS